MNDPLEQQIISLGIRKCDSGAGWHAYARLPEQEETRMVIWYGEHRDTEEEAIQDVWSHAQQMRDEALAKHGPGSVSELIPAYMVN